MIYHNRWICGLLLINVFFICIKGAPKKHYKKKFVVVTASYNNILFVDKYLESIFSQKCHKSKFTFRVIYYDDCSTDGTWEAVEDYKKQHNLGDKLCILRNNERVGAHENIYHAIHSCNDDEIILIVDGDDWLAHDGVLEILYKAYSDPDVWITYGQYKRYPDGKLGVCCKIPKSVIKNNSFRSYKWVSSHLRTFYAWLYKCIKKEDLMYKGKFVPFGGDLAIMFPMLEMAGYHSRFISDVLYIYNCVNSASYLNLIKKDKHKTLNKKRSKEIKKMKQIHTDLKKYLREDLTPYIPLDKSNFMIKKSMYGDKGL